MKLLNFTIIKLTLCLIIGILLAEYIGIPLNVSLYLALALWVGVAVLFILVRQQTQKHIWFGLLTYLSAISIGILVYNLHDQQQFKRHYSQFITEGHYEQATLNIRERLKPGVFNDKYIVDILEVNHKKAKGKVLLNIKKDSTREPYKVDDVIWTSADFKTLANPLNPNQFDYRNFLRKQYVHHQIFSDRSSLLTLRSKRYTLFGYADALRSEINTKLKAYHFKPEELAIINALILGQRQDMSKTIYDSYTDAGAIHILAVSGLHVGLILMLLTIGLKPLEQLKNGKLIKTILIIILLWSFAVVAGLSASVTRAVTMFSIVAIALHFKRPTNIYNTLAISMFVLLLFKPMFVFDVGFQLSYVAVFAIVTIQPLLYRLWKPKWKWTDYLWQILTVTVAAQFGVAPLSLYYFHQFPSLFFISNLAIIPILGVILGLGLIIIVLALVNVLPQFLADAYGVIISAMNAVMAWVSQQEQFLFRNVPLDAIQVFACYACILSCIVWYIKPSFRRLVVVLISVLFLQGSWMFTSHKHSDDAFIVFHKTKQTLIGQKSRTALNVVHNFDSLTFAKDKILSNFKVGNFMTSQTVDSLKSVYRFRGKTLLVIDSMGIYNVQRFTPQVILLRNSPRINLNRLIDTIHPEIIVADGSNYKSYLARWRATCSKRKLPYHQTDDKGAFILR